MQTHINKILKEEINNLTEQAQFSKHEHIVVHTL